MRTAFIKAIEEVAAEDERVWLVCGDLGYSVVEGFASHFPQRFLNAGVAEQNMTGIAAGLAMSGKIVFTYSIANFPVMRCLEQTRNDVCYHNSNVKIVAVGGGFAYASQGYTHQGLEDLAVTRVLPNMTVMAPGDPVEARLATRAIARHQGPCYLRLGRANEPLVHKAVPPFELGRAIVMREGMDLAIISTGGMLETAVRAGELLGAKGISALVLSMHTVQPVDDAAVARAAGVGKIITVEEHGIGGLGSAVAESLAHQNLICPLRMIHVPREAVKVAGSQAWLRTRYGISAEAIVEAAGT